MTSITGQDNAVGDYDEIPYLSTADLWSHPDHLAAIATCRGMQPPPVEDCRVLELGCNNGLNLIAMADALPGASFHGIDLAGEGIREGQRIIESSGVRNVRLEQMDLLDLPEDAGEYDYIIVTGVYTWVSSEIQHRILEICRRHLSPQGVIYIHYGAYPGYHLRVMIRDMVLYHVRDSATPRELIRRAREVIQALLEAIPDNSGYNGLLRHKLNELAQRNDSDLYHDYLARHITPIYLADLAAQAGEHELQYLSDTGPGTVQADTFAEQAPASVRRLTDDPLALEQTGDFLRVRADRSSLLCHRSVALTPRPDPGHVQTLRVSGPLKPTVATPDLQAGTTVQFRADDGRSVAVRDPLQKAMLCALAEVTPEALPYHDVLEQVAARLARAGDEVAVELAGTVTKYFERGLLRLHTDGPRLTRTPGDRPEAGALARYLATGPEGLRRLRSPVPGKTTVINRLHNAVALDPASARLLTRLDGHHDRADLARVLKEAPAGPGSRPTDQQLAEMLEQFGKAGLLIG